MKTSDVKSWMGLIRKQFLPVAFCQVINKLTVRVGGSFVELYCYWQRNVVNVAIIYQYNDIHFY